LRYWASSEADQRRTSSAVGAVVWVGVEGGIELEVVGGRWRSLEVVGGRWRSLEVVGGEISSRVVVGGDILRCGLENASEGSK
jgi:hypothetical protein